MTQEITAHIIDISFAMYLLTVLLVFVKKMAKRP